MKVFETQKIRNIALVGQAGAGKTTLCESFLFTSGAINRQGTVEEKNTVSDYNEIEQERSHSVFVTPTYVIHNDNKINILDTPGYSDYFGEVCAAQKVVETVAIVINAQNGIEVGAENSFEHAAKSDKSVVFIINKLDQEHAKFDDIVEELKSSYGNSSTVVHFPANIGVGFNSIVDVITMSMYVFSKDGKFEKKEIPDNLKSKADGFRSELIESIAETDEELMNKYFDAGDLTPDELKNGLKKAIANRQIFPILCSSGKLNSGTKLLLDFFTEFLPNPSEGKPWENIEGAEVSIDSSKQNALFVYKLFSEAHLGDMTFFKIVSGNLKTGLDLLNEQKNQSERFNQIFIVNGKKREEIESLSAGDLGATVKLKSTQINHTLHDKAFNVVFKPIDFPKPIVRVAVVPRTKGEEEKVGMGLNSICLEDQSLKLQHSQELRQMILFGLGELQLTAAKWRLEHRYKVIADFIEPRVPYRETIQKQVRGSYRHKKQSGGAGQFAEVHMMIEPWYEGVPDPKDLTIRGRDMHELDWGGKLEFVNCIVGGAIEQRFFPAILKGVMEKMQIGPLTGSYVRDIRVFIYDGKMHPVDSNEAAFKTAGMMVFKNNFVEAAPKILEPIYNVVIKVPEEFVGDVMSDLPTRRGVIQGIDSEGKYQKINARMPLAELDKYAPALRSMTQAKATYSAEFVEYQSVPPNVQQELMEAYKKSQTEE
ncbi:elongation factor G [Bacteroidetes/Chlorobi group bacterium ChocPot_Mid]|nr:MAG: elongation factor G [Bacteroidetes/Chlorobi group bacterium ChocPot_Mid]